MIDCVASEPHFRDHTRSIRRALGADFGELHTGEPPRSDTPTLVASFGDMKKARRQGRPVIYMEHGAGQSYANLAHGSYIGGDRDGVIGVLVPNERAAERQRQAHPDIPVHVVGCPKLDAWHQQPTAGDGIVGYSHHWNCTLVPETRSAFRHYRGTWKHLGGRFDMLGHGHPRIFTPLEPLYRRAGWETTHAFAEVVDRADVYVVDNSSTLFEFAALDRPVVVLNCPWYRRDIEHGMRFWEYADIGVQVDRPGDLADAIARTLSDDPQQERRRKIVEEVYGPLDGQATARAVAAIRALV